MVTIGTMFKENKRDKVQMTITLDERIADGFYFAKSLKIVNYVFAHPELLMDRIADPLPDEAIPK